VCPVCVHRGVVSRLVAVRSEPLPMHARSWTHWPIAQTASIKSDLKLIF
jgi:hypothetical protein